MASSATYSLVLLLATLRGYSSDVTLQDVLGKSSHIDRIIQQCDSGDGYVRLDENHKDIERSLLDFPQPTFLESFSSPCWLECLPKDKSKVYPDQGNVRNEALVPHMLMLDERIRSTKRSWRLRCLPKFYVVGFPKCGTTDIIRRIVAHPDVTMMGVKEIRFWSGPRDYNNDVYALERYLDTTDIATLKIIKDVSFDRETMDLYHPTIFGDGSPETIYNNKKWSKYVDAEIDNMLQAGGPVNYSSIEYNLTPKYLSHVQPQALVIVMLRDPVEMVYSSYKSFHDKSYEPSTAEFHKCVLESIKAMAECEQQYGLEYCSYLKIYDFNITSFNRQNFDCFQVLHSLQTGRFHVYIRSWLRYFPREQFHFIKIDDKKPSSQDVLKGVWTFLGLHPLVKLKMAGFSRLPVANIGHKWQIDDMKSTTRSLLYKYFKPANYQLATLLNDDVYL